MTTKKLKALITGAGGQIGQAISDHFRRINIPMTALTKSELDISSYKKLKNVFSSLDFDVIINCSGLVNLEEAERYPELAYQTNVEGVRFLADLSKKHHKTMVHFSSNYIFDGKNTAPYTENDLPNPLNTYGKTKLEGEKIIQETLPQHLIIRTSWVFSELNGHNILLKFLQKGLQNNLLKVVDDQYGCPTSASSIAHLLGKFCQNNFLQEHPGLYHFCGKESTTWYNFACETASILKQLTIADIAVSAIKTNELPGVAQRPRNGILNSNKISQLGIMQPSWQKELKNIILKLHSRLAEK